MCGTQIFDCCPRNFLIQEERIGNVVSTSHWIRLCIVSIGGPAQSPWMQTPLDTDPLDAEPPGGRAPQCRSLWMQTSLVMWPVMHAEKLTPPPTPGWTEWYTGVKTLPFLKVRLQAVINIRIWLYWSESDIGSRWVHRESNLMFILIWDKENFSRSLLLSVNEPLESKSDPSFPI